MEIKETELINVINGFLLLRSLLLIIGLYSYFIYLEY